MLCGALPYRLMLIGFRFPAVYPGRTIDSSLANQVRNFLGNVQRGQQRAFLVAGGTSTALLAGEGDKHLMLAVGAEMFVSDTTTRAERQTLTECKSP